MKKLKKVAITLMLATLGFGIGQFNETKPVYAIENNQSAITEWQHNAITSPTENKLIGAGHIDIKWKDITNLGEVKNYNIYLDGKLNGTVDGKTTKYDIYATDVKTYKVYVEADFSDGSKITTDTLNFFVTKKGICVDNNMAKKLNPADLNVGWYYDWGKTPLSYSTFSGYDFVPMIWGREKADDISNKVTEFASAGYKYVLGFNEPDLQGQALMSVNEVVGLWPSFMNKGIKVGSPATAAWPSNSTNWFQPFMKQINSRDDLDVDFITIHCYQNNFQGKEMATWFVEEVVGKAWEMYHKPIWITEFSTTGQWISEDGTREFIEAVIPMLDKLEYVERYSFFSFNAAKSPAGLWNHNTGEITSCGKAYAQNGNPQLDYTKDNTASTYLVENKTTKPAKVKIKSVKNIKGKKIKISIKKIKGIKAYQIKYSDNKKFNGYWTKTSKKTSYTIKKLRKGKKYYIKVRAYKMNGKKKVYGPWSKIKKIKIKK